jgi:hypothetical protein
MSSAPAQTSSPIKPTNETYEALQLAYDVFNKSLFGDTLPDALITLQRRKGSYGFFAGARFQHEDGRKADEIALNPSAFPDRSQRDVLATLAHEMVHLWQHHHGTPGRGRYHNREWAAKMVEIGLQPTDDGTPEGKPTGEAVSHVIIEGGRFDVYARAYLSKGYAINWREAPLKPPGSSDTGGDVRKDEPEKSGKRLRYSCPECGLNAWARHDARLICGDHQVLMIATG